MTLQTDPICGRIHPIFGLLMDGNDLNDEYDLKKDPYKPTTQLCTPKQSSSPKRELLDARYDPSKLKFHGKLETPVDCVTNNYKEEFLQDVKEQVSY